MPALAQPTDTQIHEPAGAILARTLSEADLNHMLGQLGGGRSASRGGAEPVLGLA